MFPETCVSAGFSLGADDIYRCDAFQQFAWQAHGFGTRIANPPCDVGLRQIHSNRVLAADGLGDREAEGDALISNHIGVAIGIRTADCVPILIVDPKQRAVAAVHAGWRGTAEAIAAKAVTAMADRYGTSAADVLVAFGPSIRKCCYEVGAEVAARFNRLFPEWLPQSGSRHVDLLEANRRILIDAGVNASQIFDSGLCTRCEAERFYSFRRDPSDPGRMLASIARIA